MIKQKRRNLTLSEDFIAIFNFKNDPIIIENFFENMSLRAKIVIIDDINTKTETFETILVPKILQSKIPFILVSGQIPTVGRHSDWPELCLRSADRLESSFLGFLLRRRVLSIETLTFKANDSMIIAVNWLNRYVI